MARGSDRKVSEKSKSIVEWTAIDILKACPVKSGMEKMYQLFFTFSETLLINLTYSNLFHMQVVITLPTHKTG